MLPECLRGTSAFRRSLQLPATAATEATLFTHADNSVRVFANGTRIRGSDAPDWSQSGVYD